MGILISPFRFALLTCLWFPEWTPNSCSSSSLLQLTKVQIPSGVLHSYRSESVDTKIQCNHIWVESLSCTRLSDEAGKYQSHSCHTCWKMFLWIESSGETRSSNPSATLLSDGCYLKLRDIISFVQGDIYWISMLTVSQTSREFLFNGFVHRNLFIWLSFDMEGANFSETTPYLTWARLYGL